MGIWQRIPDQTNSKHKKVWSDQQQDRLRTSDREGSQKWAERGSLVGQLLSEGGEEGIRRVSLPDGF